MKNSCLECSLSPMCLPAAIELGDMEKLEGIIKKGKPLGKGEHLFRADETFRSVYAVKSGCIKSYILDENGVEQITGFYLPGELLGMDGISVNKHYNSAITLDTSAVCEVPFDKLEALSIELPSLQRHFFQIMSKEIQSDKQLHMLLGKKPADERIASFILSLSARHAARNLSANAFRLPMSRGDIGNYLGLTVETVSRVLTRFQKSSILEVNGRDLNIIGRIELCEKANMTQSISLS